ncbi:MAG: prepilin-type N-terminal cleavage/methylation domain-containing protein [Candidatus Paceibacterota bacterium]|jgi:prepilin-type N-terminal cleavage/methylation domain-containing protein
MFTRRGFTLVELLVTISLLTAFIAFLVPYGKDMNKQIVLFNAQNELVSALYEARSMAAAAYAAGNSDKAACSYGVVISGNAIRIVQDIPSGNVCLLPAGDWSGSVFPNSSPTDIKTISFPSSISLDGFSNLRAITFVPPDMYAYFEGSGLHNTPACITITGSTGSLGISVGRFGDISANNHACP